MKKRNLLALIPLLPFLSLGACTNSNNKNGGGSTSAALSFSFESTKNSRTKDNASGKNYLIDYVFSAETEKELEEEQGLFLQFKESNDPLQKQGVSGKSLYMDGFSTKIVVNDYKAPKNKEVTQE